MSNSETIAIIVAAGSGSRVGGDLPKQYLSVKGKPLLRHCYEAFLAHPAIARIFIVIGDGQLEMARRALNGLEQPIYVTGSATRRKSVAAGLQAAKQSGASAKVLIHDAARPFLSSIIIDRLVMALNTAPGAVPALPVVDSLSRGGTALTETVERQGLWRIQTPQAFDFEIIYTAHANWDSKIEATDDARMAMAAGHEVVIVEGDEALSKYTFANDFMTSHMESNPMIRMGNGYDVHRLVAGEELWLCGVKINHTHGLSGHSDADVAIHALVDAILGALALGDIGDHFPPSDATWKGASSDQFLVHSVSLAQNAGYAIGNVDLTIICEAPKIGPHKTAMRERLAQIMGCDMDAISVKATTTEKLGFTGRGEGIAAQASAILTRID